MSNPHPVRRTLAITLIKMLPLWLILAGIIVVAVLFFPLFGKPLIQLFPEESTTVSDLVLQEIRQVCTLNTVKYVYKIVFPYDFAVEGSTVSQIKSKIGFSPDWASRGNASKEELDYYHVIAAAERAGLKIDKPDYQFLVVTVSVEAGFDLSSLLPGAPPPSAGTSPMVEIANVTHDGKATKKAVVRLPPAIVTNVTVQDQSSAEYSFPDVQVSPEGWKSIAVFVSDEARKRSLSEGILDRAESKAEVLLTGLLRSAGVGEVEYQPSVSPQIESKSALPSP